LTVCPYTGKNSTNLLVDVLLTAINPELAIFRADGYMLLEKRTPDSEIAVSPILGWY